MCRKQPIKSAGRGGLLALRPAQNFIEVDAYYL